MSDRAARLALTAWKRCFGPALRAVAPGDCRFQPTCSEYAAIAVANHGALRGSLLSAWRLLRCHPFSRGGWDPVLPATPIYHRCAAPPGTSQPSSQDHL